jgi:ligand-binding sensor domain-containing protein
MKHLSKLQSWAIIGSVILVIAVSTFLLSISGEKQACNCTPEGWKTIRPPGFTLTLAEVGESIWSGGPEGLAIVDRLTGNIVTLPTDLNQISYVRDLIYDGDTIWIAHLTGLSSYREGVLTAEPLGFPQGPALALFKDSSGRIWAGTRNGVAFRDNGEWVKYTAQDGLGFSEINVIYQDRQGDFWFGSDTLNRGGLTHFDGKSWTSYTMKDGLVHNSVNAILQDRNNDIWVGTGFGGTGGANLISGGKISSLTEKDGFADLKVRSLFEDRSGNIWFGFEYDGLAVKTPTGFIKLSPQNGLAGWEILNIIEDSQGKIWIATENGLTRLESDSAINNARQQ